MEARAAVGCVGRLSEGDMIQLGGCGLDEEANDSALFFIKEIMGSWSAGMMMTS
jgi:hypothetical protein